MSLSMKTLLIIGYGEYGHVVEELAADCGYGKISALDDNASDALDTIDNFAKYKDEYQVPVSITMGGCIDFIGADIKRAPMWMQKSGLEWFFRFAQEPKRLFKRYFVDDMQIFPLVLKYKLGIAKS